MPLDWWLHLRRLSVPNASALSKVDAEVMLIGAALIALGFLHLL